MSRRWSQTFRCHQLQDLLRQLSFVPEDKRIEQCRRIERLHDEINPDVTYPLDYLVYRITRYRRDEPEQDVLLVGEAVLPDLRLMIDHLSRTAELRLGPGEEAETAEELAARVGVSTKTIARWRRDGLRWRWITPPTGGRKQLVILKDASERYLRRNAEQVSRAAGFSQIPVDQRQRLVERARRLAQAEDLSLNQVAAHLSRRTGRALETIRQILQKHDRDHADDPIFVERRPPLTPQQRRVIARAYRMGVPVSRIARRFGRTRATVYRAINDRRAAAARRLPLQWVAVPTFDREDADAVILRPDVEPYPPHRPRAMSSVPVDDLPGPLQPLYRQPIIDDDRQRSLFVRFNYLKHKAAAVRDSLDRYSPRATELDQFAELVDQARKLRDVLVTANLPTVLSVARRHLVGQTDRSQPRLVELLAAGNVATIEAVDHYDPTREATFSRYHTNVLLRQFATVAEDTATGRRRAHRRQTAEQTLRRLIEEAGESGVHLGVNA